ncbi:MAG: type II secretion system secretin GspD [Archangium sp.]|nr:type II secretion system secretin GspD [Archangium sp.]
MNRHVAVNNLGVLVVALAALSARAEPREGCLELRKTARFTVYFEHVELEKLVQTVSDATCKSFLVAENVRGKISIVGPDNGKLMLDADQFYAAFLAALDANGLAAVPSGRFIRIVDKKTSRAFPIPVLQPGDDVPSGSEVITRLHRLKNVDVEAAKPAVQAFLSQGGEVATLPPDLLIITDLANNQQRIEKVLATVDVARPLSEVTRLVPVRFAAADEVLDKVTRALAPKTPPKPGEFTLTSLADERTNRILLVGSPAQVDRAEQLVTQLDIEVPGDARARVVKLNNADAKDIAATLEAMTSGASSSSQRRPPVPGMPQPATSGATTTGDVRISVNEPLNALLVVSSANDFRALSEVITQLDQPVRQVFIETVIMEVNITRDSKFGVSVHGMAGNSELGAVFGSQPSGSTSSLDVSTLAASNGLLFGLQGSVLTQVASLLGVNIPKFGLSIQASQDNSDVNVLSMPHILTADNKEAVITVGQRVPFQLGLNSTQLAAALASGNSTVATQTALSGTVSREKVELKLTVKPHIGAGDDIRLEIDQQAEELTGISNTAGPLTATRGQKTMVVAKNEETVVLGGIMQDRDVDQVSKTPLLGDIPLLGALFRHTNKTKTKVNLIVLMTPHVVNGSADFKRLVERKMEERARVLEQFYGGGNSEIDRSIDYGRKPGPLATVSKVIDRETRVIEPK